MNREEVVSVALMILFLFTCLLFNAGCRGPAGLPGKQGAQGLPGIPGAPGADGTSFVGEIIDPCPSIAATHPEVLFLINGVFYAVYASGQKIHLSALNENTIYSTTDGRACEFMIVDGAVVQQ
jgi:hypothetical protein